MANSKNNANLERRRILFVSEAVTLAYVSRLWVLAQTLDARRYEVHFAVDPRQTLWNFPDRIKRWNISSLSTHDFLLNLSKGLPIHDQTTLNNYVEEDCRLIRTVKPNLVIGDLRLSLCVSTNYCQVPYANLTNAYWSQYSDIKYFPVPDVALVRFFGERLSRIVFNRLRTFIFKQHVRPINQLRQHFGQKSFGDLREFYTAGDYTLFADTQDLVPTHDLPKNHSYLGPILWSPPLDLPVWWTEIPKNKPLIYLTMGSSGELEILPLLIRTLAKLPVTIIVATANRCILDHLPSNVFSADYLSGSLAAQRAAVVICNGGSPTVYQALAVGTPVLAIPSNLDQHLNMLGVIRIGAGALMRSDALDLKAFKKMTQIFLEKNSFKENSTLTAQSIALFNAEKRFPRWLASLIL